ncbi:sterol desaturase family protein [Marinicauda algicola]|uniref:Sterol desaturase family protein n=1 Tax=Marinicauda algicola TaxID=2029849 RepID=A0A4S2H2W7_9PROT|nr:sterol desaturase family protein [Marinicauda algicola]TGY89935.1 sterol desaturase family protein [Marinicauda algicola]
MIFNWINALIVAGLLALMVLETLFPARELPKVKFWRVRALAMTALFFVLAGYSPLLWYGWIGHLQLFDLSGVPLWAQVPLGYLALQVIQAAWHRTLHASDTLWRLFHQMHHSQERLDTFGALYFHPFDAVGFTFVASFALVLVGVDPMAGGIIGVIGAWLAIFTHTNVKTPRWLGYFIARPESHALHHGRGIHAYNYAELPIVDMMFGTFRNPKTRVEATGFYDGASARIVDMLLFRDVSKPRDERPAQASPEAGHANVVAVIVQMVLAIGTILAIVAAFGSPA